MIYCISFEKVIYFELLSLNNKKCKNPSKYLRKNSWHANKNSKGANSIDYHRTVIAGLYKFYRPIMNGDFRT